jgi:hypothetical protein
MRQRKKESYSCSLSPPPFLPVSSAVQRLSSFRITVTDRKQSRQGKQGKLQICLRRNNTVIHHILSLPITPYLTAPCRLSPLLLLSVSRLAAPPSIPPSLHPSIPPYPAARPCDAPLPSYRPELEGWNRSPRILIYGVKKHMSQACLACALASLEPSTRCTGRGFGTL